MSDTKYQITKTERFKLEPMDDTELPKIKEELLKIRPDASENEVSLEDVLNGKDAVDFDELNQVSSKLLSMSKARF